MWAAILSLEDAAELVRVASALRWRNNPRGHDNLDLHERYGDGLLPWLEQLVDGDGVLSGNPWCTQACLLACTSKRAFDLAYRVHYFANKKQPTDLAMQWVERHPKTGLRELARRAEEGDKRAAVLLRRLGGSAEAPGPKPRGLAEAILQHLDDYAERAFGQIDYAHVAPSAVARWPHLTSPHPELAFGGLRLVAARARRGNGWGIVLERITGTRDASPQITQYLYGSAIPGGYALRARLLERGFGSAEQVLPHLALTNASILIETAEFEHVVGTHVFGSGASAPWNIPPSASPTYRSLAEALARRKPQLFDPGTPNTRPP
jgi:hypothetical protein